MLMDSFGRLKFVRQLDAGDTQSYIVFDPERERELLLHILPQDRNAENTAVWERLDAGLAAARKIILERGSLLGVQYVVTEYIQKSNSSLDLRETPAKEKNTPVIETASAGPGEFTQFFQTAAPRTHADRTTNSGSHKEPGEFTNFFQSSAEVTNPLPAEPPVQKLKDREIPATVDKPEGPLDEAVIPVQPQPSSPSSSASDKAEFASYFQTPLGKGSPEINFGKKVREVPKEAPKPPGDFTRMFGRPFQDVREKSAERPNESGGATGVFSTGTQPDHSYANRSFAPGDYTKAFGPSEGQNGPSLGPTESVAANAPTQRTGPPVLILVALGALLIFAIALVLYFLLKH